MEIGTAVTAEQQLHDFLLNTYFTSRSVVPTALLLPCNWPGTRGGYSRFQTTFVPGFAVYTLSYSLYPDIFLHINSTECTLYTIHCTVRLLIQVGRNNYNPYNPKFVGNTGNRTQTSSHSAT